MRRVFARRWPQRTHERVRDAHDVSFALFATPGAFDNPVWAQRCVLFGLLLRRAALRALGAAPLHKLLEQMAKRSVGRDELHVLCALFARGALDPLALGAARVNPSIPAHHAKRVAANRKDGCDGRVATDGAKGRSLELLQRVSSGWPRWMPLGVRRDVLQPSSAPLAHELGALLVAFLLEKGGEGRARLWTRPPRRGHVAQVFFSQHAAERKKSRLPLAQLERCS